MLCFSHSKSHIRHIENEVRSIQFEPFECYTCPNMYVGKWNVKSSSSFWPKWTKFALSQLSNKSYFLTNGQMSFCFSRPLLMRGGVVAKVGNMSEKSLEENYEEKLDFLHKPLTNITYQSPVILHWFTEFFNLSASWRKINSTFWQGCRQLQSCQ